MDETVTNGAQADDARETLLIVGASSDIGLEVLRQLAPSRPRVLAHFHRSAAKLESLRESLPELELLPLQADLSLPGDVEALIASIEGQQCSPDKIVYLAAPKLQYQRFKDIAWDDFQRGLDVELRGLVAVMRAFLPAMAARKRGKVVVMLSSVTLNVPPAALSHYVTSKYAVWGLVRALAAEYATRHVNINAVSPSMVETAFLDNLPQRMVEIAAAQTPRGRNATVGDVAAAVRYLLSSDADYLTGVNIPVTGGATF